MKISVASRARGSPRTEGDPKPLFFACSRPQVLKSVKHTKTLQTAVKTHCKDIVSVRHFVNFLLLCLTAFIFCACASVAEQLISINPLLMARSLFYCSAKKRLATLAVVHCFLCLTIYQHKPLTAVCRPSLRNWCFCAYKKADKRILNGSSALIVVTVCKIVLTKSALRVIILVDNSIGKIAIIIDQYNRF